MRWNGLIEQYRHVLNVNDEIPVTLLEGNTPLVSAPRISERVNANVFLKLEGLNPTGSFKDRGMTMAVTMAAAHGAHTVVCASTGNTSASAAAYAARAGMRCLVLIPEGKIALGKLSQALIHGAEVVQVRGNFDNALVIVRELGKSGEIEIVNSINPHRIEGQKTGAFEVVDQLGRAPDMQFMPVGNAGNITAYWRGYRQYCQSEKNMPVMHGVQAAGANPFLQGHPIENPETLATAIRIGNPASWDGAQTAVSESLGSFHQVTDEEIVSAYQFLAEREGVFCEPASAASVAGLFKAGVPIGATVVCVLTGNGLKDPDRALACTQTPPVLEASLEAIKKHLGLGTC